jgi:hypothetical protein
MDKIVLIEKAIKKFQEEGFFLWIQFIRNTQLNLYNVFYCG